MDKQRGFTPLETPAKSETGISGTLFLTDPVRKDVRKNFSNGAGFTLVELLVVIAIIALLMSILMPALARVKRQVKATACMSNLNQWGHIFAMYTGAHDGYFMGGYWTVPTSQAWMVSLRSYYGEPGKLTCCPVATKPRTAAGGTPTGHRGTFSAWGIFPDNFPQWGFIKGDYGSYGINSWLYNAPETERKEFWRRDDVKDAANIPLFLDSKSIGGWPNPSDGPSEYEEEPWRTGNGTGHFCINRHDGGINCVFLDYSVRKIGLKQLWKFRWHRQYNTNGPWTIAGGVTQADWESVGTGWMAKFKDYADPY